MKTISTAILASLAAILLAGSAIGSTRAALTYYSDNYTAGVEASHIGVALIENGKEVINDSTKSGEAEEGVLLQNLLAENETFKIGKEYAEELAVSNTGAIDEYVRVRLFKSWTDEDGNKLTDLSPAYIDFSINEDGWIEDTNYSTQERTVLYYTNVLEAGETTPVFADKIRIDNKVAEKVEETRETKDGTTTINSAYKYDGAVFHVRAEVDAVQTHNAQDAMKSAWGVDVTVAEDGTISLK